jgi:hypothetical protein
VAGALAGQQLQQHSQNGYVSKIRQAGAGVRTSYTPCSKTRGSCVSSKSSRLLPTLQAAAPGS